MYTYVRTVFYKRRTQTKFEDFLGMGWGGARVVGAGACKAGRPYLLVISSIQENMRMSYLLKQKNKNNGDTDSVKLIPL